MPQVYIFGHHAHQPRPVVAQPSDAAYRIIPLTQGQLTRVDAKNYEWLMGALWNTWRQPYTGTFYARLSSRLSGFPNHVMMQAAIRPAPQGMVVDHIDRDSLNNTEGNLRVATHSQNGMNHKQFRSNLSGMTGISRVGDIYRVRIKFNYKDIHIGHFKLLEEAIAARRAKEIELFGEFARVQRDSEDGLS